ncbi:MAG TPA: response regulator [Arenibacter sp.]|nr:response regulator [Arenibacter sp.]
MKRILIIEDDTVLRENIAEILSLARYKVTTASDGRKGVNAAKQQLPDVIICDIMMPELDGYGVLEDLSEDVTTKQIPFIFLSAKTERQDIRKGMDLGADDYITKPFEEEELLGAIRSRLARVAILNEGKAEAKADLENDLATMRTIDQLKRYIMDNGRGYHYQMGEVIYTEGSNSNLVYLILSGAVKTNKYDDLGKELITGLYNADDFFGLSGFTKNIPYQEFATALEETRTMGIAKDALRRVLEENHQLAMELMQLLSEDLSEAKEQLLNMAYGSVRKKTASTLYKFADKLQKDQEGRIHILRSDLASVAGMATETLIRTLSSFKKEGLIRIEDRNIQILDLERLRKIF